MEQPTPEEYQPELTFWRHAWRLGLSLVISGVVWSTVVQGQWREERHLFWLDIALGVLSFVVVFWRRRAPLTVAVVLNLLVVFSGLAAGPATLAAVSVATRRRWGPIVIVSLVLVATGQVFPLVQPVANEDPVWLTFSVNLAVTAAVMGWGMYLGSRRELFWTLEQRAHRAETEQELRIAQARATERSRIAREMHDVLAHRISQISLHAGAVAFRDDLSAAEMRESAGIIRQKANEALTDLRGVLGVLRDPDTGELLSRPQPALDDIPALVAGARESGMNIDYAAHVDRTVEMPLVVGRTVYRIVQEGLTNAHKHAPGAVVTVQVSGSPDDGVDVVLRNPVGFGQLPAAPGAGLGLIGLTERAELRGGHLEHRKDGSMFVLHGWIPWAA